MSEAKRPAAKPLPGPANDNGSRRKARKAIMLVPADLPVLNCEVEVIAALLDDSLFAAANDNEPESEGS